jgi:hypothetical protein
MNKNSVMTVLLAIEIVTLLVIGILMLAKNADYGHIKEENTALQARVEEMQKSNDNLNALVKTQTRDKEACVMLSKVSRDTLLKQRYECENTLNKQTTLQCGELCTRCFSAVLRADQIIKDTKAILGERRSGP